MRAFSPAPDRFRAGFAPAAFERCARALQQ
jgi:hypothetical protein